MPAAPAAPTASVTVQPTCAIPTGTIVITAPLGAFEYSLDGGAFGAATTFTGVAPGAHNVTVVLLPILPASLQLLHYCNAVPAAPLHQQLQSRFNQLALFRQERL